MMFAIAKDTLQCLLGCTCTDIRQIKADLIFTRESTSFLKYVLHKTKSGAQKKRENDFETDFSVPYDFIPGAL